MILVLERTDSQRFKQSVPTLSACNVRDRLSVHGLSPVNPVLDDWHQQVATPNMADVLPADSPRQCTLGNLLLPLLPRDDPAWCGELILSSDALGRLRFPHATGDHHSPTIHRELQHYIQTIRGFELLRSRQGVVGSFSDPTLPGVMNVNVYLARMTGRIQLASQQWHGIRLRLGSTSRSPVSSATCPRR